MPSIFILVTIEGRLLASVIVPWTVNVMVDRPLAVELTLRVEELLARSVLAAVIAARRDPVPESLNVLTDVE